MNRRLRFGAVVLALLLALMPSASFAEAPAYTCTGGIVPPGTYSTLTIDGFCVIPDGTVLVLDGLTVKSGAALIATSTTAQVDVKGGVYVGPGAIFAFGCSFSLCPPGVKTSNTISGGIVADHPLMVVLHGNVIKGSVSLTGGGPGLTCAPLPFGPPAYSDFENNTISGSVTVTGYTSCWLGFIRNDVRGRVTFMDNQLLDPDANEYVSNTIHGNLVCSGNSPDPQIGDSEGNQNTVTGQKLGQCSGL